VDTATPTAGLGTAPLDADAAAVARAADALAALPAAPPPVVLLLAGPAAHRTGWSTRAALALARSLARRGRRVLLADLGLEDPTLHDAADVPNLEGLADVFLFGTRLADVGRPLDPAGLLLFVPAGAYVPDPAGALADPRWESLLAEIAADGRTLLAYAPTDTPGLDALARRAAAAILAAAPDEEAGALAALPPAVRVLAVLGPARAAPAEPRAPDLREPVFVRPARRHARRPLLGLALAGAGAAVALAAAWLLATRTLAPAGGSREPRREPPPAAAETPPAPAPRPDEVPLPFSVAIEAHQSFPLAVERVAALRRAEPGIEFYVAPITVGGVVYYRVMAGPAADPAGAERLMQRLVEAGHKSAPDAWSVRPTRWAFRLGDFPTRDAARARQDELARHGIPTYIVEVPYTAGPSRYRLYAGAYEGPAQAEVMRELLVRAGLAPELVERTGRPVP